MNTCSSPLMRCPGKPLRGSLRLEGPPTPAVRIRARVARRPAINSGILYWGANDAPRNIRSWPRGTFDRFRNPSLMQHALGLGLPSHRYVKANHSEEEPQPHGSLFMDLGSVCMISLLLQVVSRRDLRRSPQGSCGPRPGLIRCKRAWVTWPRDSSSRNFERNPRVPNRNFGTPHLDAA